jgi:hypothetical protein
MAILFILIYLNGFSFTVDVRQGYHSMHKAKSRPFESYPNAGLALLSEAERLGAPRGVSKLWQNLEVFPFVSSLKITVADI